MKAMNTLLNLLGALVCLIVVQAQAAVLPHQDLNTYVRNFDNQTHSANYMVYIGKDDDSQFLLYRNSKLDFARFGKFKERLHLSSLILINLRSLNSDYDSVYFRFGGYASGECSPGYAGPFFLSLWRGHEDIPYTERYFVRYCQKGKDGSLGIRVHSEGIPEIIAGENTEIIGTGNPVYEKLQNLGELKGLQR